MTDESGRRVSVPEIMLANLLQQTADNNRILVTVATDLRVHITEDKSAASDIARMAISMDHLSLAVLDLQNERIRADQARVDAAQAIATATIHSDHQIENTRWLVGLSIPGMGVIAAMVGVVVNALGIGRPPSP